MIIRTLQNALSLAVVLACVWLVIVLLAVSQ